MYFKLQQSRFTISICMRKSQSESKLKVEWIMDAMQQQQMYQERARRRKVHLQKIEGTLRRIESGEFGECFICGDDIGIKRLEFDPTQTRCIDCMESNE